MNAFMDPLDFPSLSAAQAKQFDAPITLEELKLAAASMNRHKSPGLDGVLPDLLLEIWDLVGPVLLNSIQHSLDVGYFNGDQRAALISLLLKTGNDPLDCGSYRPLSLLNSDSLWIYSVVNLLFSAIPLTPPPQFFKDIEKLCINFIWKNKRSKIRLTTLQHPKPSGGLALPNFKLYFWAFQLRFLKTWFEPSSKIPWLYIEQELVYPLRLQDLPFAGITQRSSLL